MRHELFKHRLSYVILIAVLVCFLFLFFAVWPNRAAQRVLIAVLMIFYTMWGISTHLKTDHITKQVVYEYAAISTLSGLLLFLVTF